MMRKLANTLFLLMGCIVFGQVNLINSDRPEEIGVLSDEQKEMFSYKKYLEYPHVDEKDIMWSKVVYEEIDLSEKFNHPLFFPNDNLYETERRSLWRTIREAILDGRIDVIYMDNNNKFRYVMPLDDAKKKIKNTVSINGTDKSEVLKSSDISYYRIKGVWYVDKRIGEMRYRLLGIMPFGKDLINKENKEPVPLFWLWYKDLRPILHEQLVLDDRNNVSRISFDQLLTSRRFTSRIIGMDNVFNDKYIEDYVTDPFMQLIESERLKNIIRDFEQDLWSN
jgi:gliding motility associated protien GldN